MLEVKSQETAEQKLPEQEMQQRMMLGDEETMELWGTYIPLPAAGGRSLPKKLKKLHAKLQVVNAEIQDQHEHACVEQDLEEAQNEHTQELKLKYLTIKNFIPSEDKSKVMSWFYLDCEEEQWKIQPSVPGGVHISEIRSDQ